MVSSADIKADTARTLARLRTAIKLVAQIDSASLRRDRAKSALAIVDALEREIEGGK